MPLDPLTPSLPPALAGVRDWIKWFVVIDGKPDVNLDDLARVDLVIRDGTIVVKGGQVYGSSNEKGSAPKDNPVTPQNLNATIGMALGISHKKEVYTKIGRPFNISDNAPPITDIF